MYNLDMEALFNISTSIIVISILFRIAAFENQRWVRQRMSGIRGTDEFIGSLVDLMMPLGSALWYLFLIAFGLDYSFLSALWLWMISAVSSVIYSLVMKDSLIVWMISSLILLPLIIYLIFQTTIFGLLG
jgi:hypothetical protein